MPFVDGVPYALGMTINSDDELLDTRRLAAWLGAAIITVTAWRARGAGPPYLRLGVGGRLIRYRRSDVEAWLRARTVGATATTQT